MERDISAPMEQEDDEEEFVGQPQGTKKWTTTVPVPMGQLESALASKKAGKEAAASKLYWMLRNCVGRRKW